MFQEYPKGLFKGGDPLGECRLVDGPAQEAHARADGFMSIGESKEKPAADPEPKRRGRPPKVAA